MIVDAGQDFGLARNAVNSPLLVSGWKDKTLQDAVYQPLDEYPVSFVIRFLVREVEHSLIWGPI